MIDVMYKDYVGKYQCIPTNWDHAVTALKRNVRLNHKVTKSALELRLYY